MLACAPEWGCTLTCSAPGKSASARSWASRSDHVDELAAAVVALAGQALGVLVGQPRALRLHAPRANDVVLAGDQLDLLALAVALAEHRRPELGVDVGEGRPADRGSGSQGHAASPPGPSACAASVPVADHIGRRVPAAALLIRPAARGSPPRSAPRRGRDQRAVGRDSRRRSTTPPRTGPSSRTTRASRRPTPPARPPCAPPARR